MSLVLTKPGYAVTAGGVEWEEYVLGDWKVKCYLPVSMEIAVVETISKISIKGAEPDGSVELLLQASIRQSTLDELKEYVMSATTSWTLQSARTSCTRYLT
jgi:hypothetical protein